MDQLLIEAQMEYNFFEMQLNEMQDKLNKLKGTKILEEAITDFEDGMSIEDKMVEAFKRMEAAKKAMGYVNKLKPSPEKAKHAKMVFRSMSMIRALIGRIQKEFLKLNAGNIENMEPTELPPELQPQ